jgi:hypothetical protein
MEGVRATVLAGVGGAATTHFSVLHPVSGVTMAGVLRKETKGIGTGTPLRGKEVTDPVPIRSIRLPRLALAVAARPRRM